MTALQPHTVPSLPTFMFGNHHQDKSVIIKRAPSCNIGWLNEQFCSDGPESGSTLSMMTLVSRGSPAEIDMVFRC